MFKSHFVIILISFLFIGTSSPTFAMWGTADEDNEQTTQTVIQRQLEELEPLGATLQDEQLALPLRKNNQVALGIALSRSPEILNHYSVQLNYFASLSQDHISLLRIVPKLVSLKIHNQSLDTDKGSILREILTQHSSTLTALDFSAEQGFKLTDEGLIAIQQSVSALPCLKILKLKSQNSLSNNGFITLSNILPNLISIKELDLNLMNLGSTGESQLLNQFSKLTNLKG